MRDGERRGDRGEERDGRERRRQCKRKRRTREGERERGRIAAADSLPLAARVTEERGSATKVNIAEAQPSRRVI